MNEVNTTVTPNSSPRRFLWPIIGLVVAVVVVAILARGCSVTPDTYTTNTNNDKAKKDPWPDLVSGLGKETDSQTTRRVLEQLNQDLSVNTNAEQPLGLVPAMEAELKTMLPGLTEEDLKELRPTTFTRLDGLYLNDAYFFRDIVRSLEVSELPPTKQAEAIFGFVCRQMYLSPRFISTNQGAFAALPVSPAMAIKRGWGSGYERAIVFVSLLQQAGLEAGLLGPDDAVSRYETPIEPGKEALAITPANRFWAVGVRVGEDLVLFDPYRGEKFPGTLKELKAKPELLEPWQKNTKQPWDLPAEKIKAAKMYLLAPLSGLAPRWKTLEAKLSGSSTVKVFHDPKANIQSIVNAKVGVAAEYWSPKAERSRFDFTHALVSYTTVEEGGRDATKGGPGLQAQYLFAQFPQLSVVVPAEFKQPAAGAKLRDMCYNYYFGMILSPPTAYERILKGQFFEASTQLSDKERLLSPIVRKYQGGQSLPPAVRKFASDLNEKYEAFGLAKIDQRPEAGSLETEINAMWGAREIGPILDRAMAETTLAEITYLLAVSKQESAERTTARAARAEDVWAVAAKDATNDPAKVQAFRTRADQAKATALDAWKAANGWWETYDAVKAPTANAFPGRAEHIKTLADRAANLAKGN